MSVENTGGDDPTGVAAALAAKAAADKAAADKAAADKTAADAVEAEKKAKEEADKAKSGLSDEAAKLLKENMKAKKDLEEARAKLKTFEGIDAEAVRKLLAEQAEAEKKALEAKGEWDRLKKMMADEHTAALKKAQDELEAERKEKTKLSGTIQNLTVGTAFASSKFITAETVLPPAKARAIFGAHFEADGDQVVAYDKPKGAGDRTMLVDAAGKPLAFEAAIKKLVETDPDHASILRSKLATGAGSRTEADAGKEASKSADGLKGISRIQAALEARKRA